MALDINQIRVQFPALSIKDDSVPRIYFDNPGGTQVPHQVIDRMNTYLIQSNANHGGPFRTSVASDAVLQEAHEAMADLLNAPSADEIIFGPNMTTLTFAVSRSLGHLFTPGDEIIVTRMDHDANISPWLLLAQDHDLTIRWLPFNTRSYRFVLDHLAELLSERTRLLAVNYASNAIGTINDIKTMARLVHGVGGLVYIDAVQYVPHGPTDVQDLDCDFLVCSAYKFYGPHQGILWGKFDLLEKLRAYKVRPASNKLPFRLETGTQCHEGQAGTLGALEYLTWIGATMADKNDPSLQHLSGRRRSLRAAIDAIIAYERSLCEHLIRSLLTLPGITIHGITDTADLDERVPTVSFTLNSLLPSDISQRLAEKNIFVWDGDYYALEVIQSLGLSKAGGMLRVGLGHYNTFQEVDRLVQALEKMVGRLVS